MAKNTDYSKSAVNLCNPVTIGEKPELLAGLNDTCDALIAERNALIDGLEVNVKIKELSEKINTIRDEIREEVELLGSYQNLDNGWYAIKQRKESLTYNVKKVKLNPAFNKYTDAVIIETVDKGKLEGLVKGGLISAEDARACADVSESFVFIIKV